MTPWIWLGCAAVGSALTLLGWRTWWSLRAAAGSLRRRVAAGVTQAGAAIALFPVFLAFGEHNGLLVAALMIYGWFVLAGWAFLAAALVFSSAPVTRRLQRVSRAVPRPGSFSTWRATAGLPSDWDGLVARNRQLSARLLDYFDVTDARVAHPVMADVTDPYTGAAMSAMFTCDRLRDAGPPAWRPARQSPYALAVADFDQRLQEAEEHSAQVNRDSVSRTERETTDRVLRSLSYLKDNATTPAERQAAYEVLAAELAELRASDLGDHGAAGVGDRGGGRRGGQERDLADTFSPLDLGPSRRPAARNHAHPWLDLIQRATRR